LIDKVEEIEVESRDAYPEIYAWALLLRKMQSTKATCKAPEEANTRPEFDSN